MEERLGFRGDRCDEAPPSAPSAMLGVDGELGDPVERAEVAAGHVADDDAVAFGDEDRVSFEKVVEGLRAGGRPREIGRVRLQERARPPFDAAQRRLVTGAQRADRRLAGQAPSTTTSSPSAASCRIATASWYSGEL